ncbi:MAG: hypothetical protein K0S09_430 [Sphingobacteriaceae bacterium]|jgi:hypothetical protein|nr:hypothetical protein [Sphingobacteriaceae bacterium]
MFLKILADSTLNQFIEDSCCENGICVDFDESISKEDRLIIKVDKFYNSLKTKVPASPDCLIIVKCKNSGYSLHIIELKNIHSSQGFELLNVLEKYQTCLDDFVSVRFKELLMKDYKAVKLYFVSNLDIYKRDLGLKYELLINYRVSYKEKQYLIRPMLPTPAIKMCY